MKKEKIKKFTALCAGLSFLFTLIPQNAFSQTTAKAASYFEIQASAGKITSRKDFSSEFAVINIQDLHNHAQAQKNIERILESLDKQLGLEKIYLEGAFGQVDMSYMSGLLQKEPGKTIIENLTDMGNLDGAAYYSVLSGRPKIIYGIEDKAVYDRNIKLFNDIIDAMPEVEKIC